MVRKAAAQLEAVGTARRATRAGGDGIVTFSEFVGKFQAVRAMRNEARLRFWHRTFGLGVAGNVAGHMAQAG